MFQGGTSWRALVSQASMRISALVRCSFVLIAIAVCNAAAQDQAVASLHAGRSSELGRFQSSLQCLVLAPVPLLIRPAERDIDYRATCGLDKSVVRALAKDSAWVRNHENIFVIGPCGVGKSFLASALAQKALSRRPLRSLSSRCCLAA
jgi:transcriptional regulator with AAA-type ATPase domain